MKEHIEEYRGMGSSSIFRLFFLCFVFDSIDYSLCDSNVPRLACFTFVISLNAVDACVMLKEERGVVSYVQGMRDFLCVRLERMCPRLVTQEDLASRNEL